MAIIELVLIIAVAALILLCGQRTSATPVLPPVERWLRLLAQKRALSVLLVGLACLGFRLILLPILGVPEPGVGDEFSYQLAGDTFSLGRVTNPTHPMWVHFETLCVNQQPAYMSKYPPGQGLALALGILLGHPWIGVLLTTALMCSAICWMLQGWLPAPWPLLGGILAVLRLGTLSYWMNSYWGGSLAAIGGALLLGALPRLQRYPNLRDALIMALGLVLLANTRPYEGLALGLPAALVLIVWFFKQKHFHLMVLFRRVVLPILIVLAVMFGAIGYYNFRGTGSIFRMPYQVNQATYRGAPLFLFLEAGPQPVYRHAEMRTYYENYLRGYYAGRTLRGALNHSTDVLFGLWLFYLGPALSIAFLGLPWVLHDPQMRAPFFIGGVFLLALLPETWMLPHYFAPATALLYLMILQCLRYLRQWRWHGQPIGLALRQAILIICCAMVVLRIMAVAAHAQIEPWPGGNLERASVSQKLQTLPGRHLVIVHYSPNHIPDREWVFNRADIDDAKIVWARDMGERDNQPLLRYFKDHTIWIVYPDEIPLRLQPLAAAGGTTSSPSR